MTRIKRIVGIGAEVEVVHPVGGKAIAGGHPVPLGIDAGLEGMAAPYVGQIVGDGPVDVVFELGERCPKKLPQFGEFDTPPKEDCGMISSKLI